MITAITVILLLALAFVVFLIVLLFKAVDCLMESGDYGNDDEYYAD